MSLVSYINICKEIRDILNYLRNNSNNLTIEEIKKLYIRYLYLLTRVVTILLRLRLLNL